MANDVQSVILETEAQRRYLNYAVSVISSRALPDVRDGLKPVQRRILYAMWNELHLYPEGRPAKCARIIGEVTGKFHPHGDDAAYEALVRMAQDFVMREKLVEGQGNFGSVDGDPPAARRYTEARLARLAVPLLAELRQNTVDLRPTYNNELEEPVVLPAQFPHLLVNGASGIAVGMATSIPPHNLGEVVRACIRLIEEPEVSLDALLKIVKGPDFPLGGKVVADRATLRKIYEEGAGTIRVQGEWRVEEVGRNRQQIVITSIPYNVDKRKLEQDIGAIIAERKLPQLLDLTNETNEKAGLRIALEMKPGSDPNVIMAYLFKHTELQTNFSYNMTCLVPVQTALGERMRPERLGLREILRQFLDFRLKTVRRRFAFELEQLRRRIHILEGFQIIFNALDRAIRMIRDSQGKADAAGKLRAAFQLSETQADAVLDAQIYKIAQMEICKILDELAEKKADAQRIERILSSEQDLWAIIKDELQEVEEKFGDKRRTRMGSADDAPDFDPEAYIVRENTNVVLTRDGWIKRVGRLASVETTRVREGDQVLAVIPGSTVDHVVFFADDGTAYTMRINEVPASSGYGEPITKFFRLADQVRIIGAATTDERFTPPDTLINGEPAGPFLLVVTAQGLTLRTPLTPFRAASTRVGRRYVRLVEGDRVVQATVLGDEDSLFLASASGRVLHFPIAEINVLSGAGKGVQGIKLEPGDTCLGGQPVGRARDRLVVETSNNKLVEFLKQAYPTVGRAGKGFEAIKRGRFLRVVPPPIALVDWDQIEGKSRKAESNGEQKSLFDYGKDE